MDDDFKLRVTQQVLRLKSSSCRTIERETADKRIEWFEKNRSELITSSRPSPRSAYELLFNRYMGLPVGELPVTQESETEIVWLSKNQCPTLEACRELGLDTRKICRAAYEKSTQALVSRLDPQLRFLRSYEEIRPYHEYCKEMIIRVDFQNMMQKAIEEAGISLREGNQGYGAVVAIGNCIIGKAHDTTITGRDPSLHAEVNAIRQAARVLNEDNLSGSILFSTCEPCPMCASLAVWANLTTIVYGVSAEDMLRLGKAQIGVSAREIMARSQVMIEMVGEVLADECKSLYT